MNSTPALAILVCVLTTGLQAQGDDLENVTRRYLTARWNSSAEPNAADRQRLEQEALSADEVGTSRARLWQQYREVAAAAGWREDLEQRRVSITFPGRGKVTMRYHVMTLLPEEQHGFAEYDRKAVRGGDEAVLRYVDLASSKKGQRPESGWPVTISLHGGGNSPAELNDRQWDNQQRLLARYRVDGLYLVPRAPIDGPQMWHSDYMYPMWDQLVRRLIASGVVDPNRIYLMGYSEGGYCTCRVGPNMADRWGAVGTSAAGEAPDRSPLENLRNTPYILQVGERDQGFDRIGMARENAERLGGYRESDPGGYLFEFVEHPGRGHGIDDGSTGPWLMRRTRNPIPERIVWRQSGPVTTHAWWVAWDHPYGGNKPESWHNRPERITAQRIGSNVALTTTGIPAVLVRLDDRMMDLDRRVEVVVNGEKRYSGRVRRSLRVLADTLLERGDPQLAFPAEARVEVTAPK